MFDNRTVLGAQMQSHSTETEVPTSVAAVGSDLQGAITAEIQAWWGAESADWDAAVTGTDQAALPSGADLWDDMPVVDSKAVARTSPIFERHLGIPLDVKLIRPGGYRSIEDAISDLIPKMIAAAADSRREHACGEEHDHERRY
jgi:hypothetical protein